MQIVTLLNVCLLYAGAYALVKRIYQTEGTPMLILTAAVLSFAAISYLYYFSLIIRCGFIMLLAVTSVLNIVHSYFTIKFLRNERKNAVPKKTKATVLFPLAAVFFLSCYFCITASKYGGWDSWAIWNMHAKFIFDYQTWRGLFTANLAYSHPDYPLMLPSVVAFLWHGLHKITPLVPVMASYGIFICIPLLVYRALEKKGKSFFAAIALALFLTDDTYKVLGCSQEADVLLSLFMLITFITYHKIKETPASVYLLGFFCGSCAWIKNEGIAFLLVFTIIFVISHFKQFKVIGRFFAGAFIPVLVVTTFKLFISPPNDLIAAGNSHPAALVHMLLDTSRYITIIKATTLYIVSSYIIVPALMLIALVLCRRFFISVPFIVILLLLGVYFVIYLTTPYNLDWHLRTSLNRLLQHVYPSLVYLLLLAISEPVLKRAGFYKVIPTGEEV